MHIWCHLYFCLRKKILYVWWSKISAATLLLFLRHLFCWYWKKCVCRVHIWFRLKTVSKWSMILRTLTTLILWSGFKIFTFQFQISLRSLKTFWLYLLKLQWHNIVCLHSTTLEHFGYLKPIEPFRRTILVFIRLVCQICRNFLEVRISKMIVQR